MSDEQGKHVCARSANTGNYRIDASSATAGVVDADEAPLILITDYTDNVSANDVGRGQLDSRHTQGTTIHQHNHRSLIQSEPELRGATSNAIEVLYDEAWDSPMSTIQDVYRDWEDRYSQLTTSQAEFFAPNDGNLPQRGQTRNYEPTDDEDIPIDPSVPRIVIISPDELESPASKKPLSRAIPLSQKKPQFRDGAEYELHPRPRLAERRHSMNVVPDRHVNKPSFAAHRTKAKDSRRPTPRPWIATDSTRVGGWRMRTRCSALVGTEHNVDIVVVYVYNSSVCDKSRDRDADLDRFRHYTHPSSERANSISMAQVKRAQTDLGKQSRPALPNIFAAAASHEKPQQWSEFANDRARPVDWLQDHDMLRKHIPGSRIITVGFDIFPVLSIAPDYEAAARQLIEHLQDLRQRQQQQTPILFFGHTLGGMMIVQGLVLPPTKKFFTDDILACTAGVFLFSQPVTSSETYTRKLADLLGVKANEKIFSDLSGTPAMERLGKLAKRGLFYSHPRHQDPKGPPRRKHSRFQIQQVAIGFPITHILAQDDDPSAHAQTLRTFLGAPVRNVITTKSFGNSTRFPDADDVDFARIVTLMQSAFHTCHLLQATAARDIGKVDTLIRAGVNPNLRDRWCVHSNLLISPRVELLSSAERGQARVLGNTARNYSLDSYLQLNSLAFWLTINVGARQHFRSPFVSTTKTWYMPSCTKALR